MRNVMKCVFVLVGLTLVGVNVYSTRNEDVVGQNVESLSSIRTGISIVRQENFQMTETATSFDEVTTCMSGSSQSCHAGTV